MSGSGRDLDPADIEPVGAMIAVAFTGAIVGLLGAGLSLFTAEFGYIFILLGVIIALFSPVAYLRFRSLRTD